jgi:exonuclease VII small subunit
MSAANKTTENKTIQAKISELNELVAWFDGENFVLEEVLKKYKQAEKLAGEIETELGALKNEVTVLKQSFDSEA